MSYGLPGKSPHGSKRAPEKGLKSRSLGGEDETLHKRHRTRHALHKRALTEDTVLYFAPPEGLQSDDEDEDSLDEEIDDDEASAPPVLGLKPEVSIEIPVIRTLTDEELAARAAEVAAAKTIASDVQTTGGGEEDEEPTSDSWYRRMHLVFELKEQAIREQASRSSSVRRLVQRTGSEVSSTELLLAPKVESLLTSEDTKMVMGKVDLPELSGDRLIEIEEKLAQVERSYESKGQSFSRYWLHTRFQPKVIIEEVQAASVPVPEGQPNNDGLGGDPSASSTPGAVSSVPVGNATDVAGPDAAQVVHPPPTKKRVRLIDSSIHSYFSFVFSSWCSSLQGCRILMRSKISVCQFIVATHMFYTQGR